MRRIYLFGAGGHGRELGWLAREVFPAAALEYVVDDERFLVEPINGIPVRSFPSLAAEPGDHFVAAVGDGALRKRAVAAFVALGIPPIALVHPRAELTPTVRISPGAVVGAGSVLTDNVEVAAHAHINIGCTLSHDVTIGEYATISPGVHLAGNVLVEAGAFLGVGASVINGHRGEPITVGVGATVAAGATVIRNVEARTTVGGVPARLLRPEAAV